MNGVKRDGSGYHNWFGGQPGGDFEDYVKPKSPIRCVAFGGEDDDYESSWVVIKEHKVNGNYSGYKTHDVDDELTDRMGQVHDDDLEISKVSLEHGGRGFLDPG